MTAPVAENVAARFLEQTLGRMVESPPADGALLARLWFQLRPHANQPLAAARDGLRALATLLTLLAVAGVVLIGLVNLTVSISLAFYLALRATRTSRRESGHLLLRGLVAIFKAPFQGRSARPVTEESA